MYTVGLLSTNSDIRITVKNSAAQKMSKYRGFSCPCFPVFGLNTEIYRVNVRIQSKYGKIPEKTPYLDTFYAV